MLCGACALQSVNNVAGGYLHRGHDFHAVTKEHIVEEAVRENVAVTARGIIAQSPLIAAAVKSGAVSVVGFRYDIDSPPDDDGDALTEVPY